MLWSSIHIPALNYSLTPPSILLRLEKIVEAWLERSATCPLSISVSDDQNYLGDLLEHPLVPQLISAAQRLRHLELTGDATLFRRLLRFDSKDLPLLQRLWIDSTGSRPDSIDGFQISTLEDVTLRVFASVDPQSLPLRWSQLISLRLECLAVWTGYSYEGGLDSRGVFNILKMCPNLVHCEMRVTKESDLNSPLDTAPIILPCLNTLILSDRALENWNLIAPNLRLLQIGGVRDDHKLAQDASLSADIDSYRFSSPDELRDLLYSFPKISYLRLCSATACIPLDYLALFEPPNDLCPELIHFTILSPSNEFSDAAILAVVKARMAMPTPPFKSFASASSVKWRSISCLNFNLSFRTDSKSTSTMYLHSGSSMPARDSRSIG
ncbi:F-box domain-containing protein [Mycena sanguinolenta]|uniref:F-box domain-containing protein n=1 Tax=Mycena sanguinolenta TaxID=230812 RepID=A0A8H6XWY8_9AGAR|nr:F-box domain-containing protein [Mycena sanguinolenta]